MPTYYNYLNRKNNGSGFEELRRGVLFVDKSALIKLLNEKMSTKHKYVCVSRPRRFGKTTALEMLEAYYTKGIDTDYLFQNLIIKNSADYSRHLNAHNVITINFMDCLENKSVSKGIEEIIKRLHYDLKQKYPEIIDEYLDLVTQFDIIEQVTGDKFIFLIDEWDCVFRIYKGKENEQKLFLDFLRLLLKDKTYVELAYMTGILPIKKYDTGSALNMFREYTMLDSGELSSLFGFTSTEISNLGLQELNISSEQIDMWYGGYHILNTENLHNPYSVSLAIDNDFCRNYWRNTGGFDELKEFISRDFDGLRQSITALLAKEKIKVEILGFFNDLDSFQDKDQILTALVHLGYLTYDNGYVYIPNNEIYREFSDSVKSLHWKSAVYPMQRSKDLLDAILSQNENEVAKIIEDIHDESQELKEYNNELMLKYVLHIALLAASDDYIIEFEKPSGKGIADCIVMPRICGKPGIVLEMKSNSSAERAVIQIKERDYVKAFDKSIRTIFLVGINYSKRTKKHECHIEILETPHPPNEDIGYVAHVRADKACVQTILEHLNGTAERTEKFADDFQCKEWGYACGIMHDIGKYSENFQRRIKGYGPITDHATAGAQVMLQNKNYVAAYCTAYCISGHHSGLLDGGTDGDSGGEATLMGRKKKKVDAYDKYRQDIEIPLFPAIPLRPLGKGGFSLSFFIRMLFSCLVDADFLDTENFMQGGTVQRGVYDDMRTMWECLNRHISPWFANDSTDTVNGRRTAILKACISMGEEMQGLYQLTVPTGGGKTLSSMAFALRHAIKNNLKRIIYVIPYTSIIEQNAKVFKDIFGAENVLENHSNVTYESPEELKKCQLAAENWDRPIIVTTNVQFFESLFSNRTSKCRKLHNISQSVIIFDEAQMLPVKYLKPCVQAISELVYNYNSTAVLCTATQPALESFFPPQLKAKEICLDVTGQYEFFRRTKVVHMGEWTREELIEELRKRDQVLCILNSRKCVQQVYEALKEEGTYHLSTLMYPGHRKCLLAEIRERLAAGRECRLIATSLVEAGVDFDFKTVCRELAGIDSVIQAAGRCNREGKRQKEECETMVFTLAQAEDIHLPSELKLPIAIGRQIADKYDDVSTLDAIKDYFNRLYYHKGDALDAKDIVGQFEQGYRSFLFPFASVAKQFHLIESDTKTILIDLEPEAAYIVERLRRGEYSRQLLREAGQYCVSVFKNDFEALNGAGRLEEIDSEFYILRNKEQYTQDRGLVIEVSRGDAVIF